MYFLFFLALAQEGILPPWESKVVIKHAQDKTRELTAALGQLDTAHWKGEYAPLLISTRERVLGVADVLDRLAGKPQSLAAAVEAFLSLHHIEGNLDALARGAARFQPTAVKPLEDATTSFIDARGQFYSYLTELSRYLEKNLAVESRELESCRDQLWKRPPPALTPRPARRPK